MIYTYAFLNIKGEIKVEFSIPIILCKVCLSIASFLGCNLVQNTYIRYV